MQTKQNGTFDNDEAKKDQDELLDTEDVDETEDDAAADDSADDDSDSDADAEGSDDEGDDESDEYKKKYAKARIALKEERKKNRGGGSNDLETKLEKFYAKKRQDELEDEIEEMAATIAEDPKKRAKVLDTYRNRITASGFTKKAILKDLEDAALLVDRGASAEKRARKALAQKNAMTMGSARVTSVDEDDDTSYTAEEKKFLKNYGVKL